MHGAAVRHHLPGNDKAPTTKDEGQAGVRHQGLEPRTH